LASPDCDIWHDNIEKGVKVKILKSGDNHSGEVGIIQTKPDDPANISVKVSSCTHDYSVDSLEIVEDDSKPNDKKETS